MFGMTQSNANKWIHVLLVVLHQTLLDLHDLPARHLRALEQRLAELQAPESATPETDATPLTPFFTMAPSGPSRAPKTKMSKARVIAARNSGIQ
jgi:hypothetical protein